MRKYIFHKNFLKYISGALLCISVMLVFKPASAERASLLFDPDTGSVLYAKNVRLRSFPASLTKLMTLYLLFEALDSKRLKLGDKVVVSAEAERQPSSRLGLKEGWQITIEEVLLALIIKSANDAAVVAAEYLAGGEPEFIEMMNTRAEALGMSDTLFGSASGLPGRRQNTTALDVALLTQKLLIQFSDYYPLLTRKSFKFRGKTFERPNSFINGSDNINKLKTGFTCQAGYNLVALVERDDQRLVGVILGARNVHQRNTGMARLFNLASAGQKTDQLALSLGSLRYISGQGFGGALNTKAIAESCIVGVSTDKYDQITRWGLLVGVNKTADLSLILASKTIRWFPKLLKDAKPAAIPFLRKVLLYRSYLTGLNEAAAVDACRYMRDRNYYCIAEGPETLRIRVKEGQVAIQQAQALELDNSSGS